MFSFSNLSRKIPALSRSRCVRNRSKGGVHAPMRRGERGEPVGAVAHARDAMSRISSNMSTRGSPQRLPERDRRLLADYFGVAESDALGATGCRRLRATVSRCRRLAMASYRRGRGRWSIGKPCWGLIRSIVGCFVNWASRQTAAAMLRVRGHVDGAGAVRWRLGAGRHGGRRPTPRAGVHVVRIDECGHGQAR